MRALPWVPQHRGSGRSLSAPGATAAHKKQLLYQNTQRTPRQLQGTGTESAARTPKANGQGEGEPPRPPRAAPDRAGRAKKGTFGAKLPVTQLPGTGTWGQEAAKKKKDGFNSELALGIRKSGRQRGQQALPSWGTPLCGVRAALRCQSRGTSGWLPLRMHGDTRRHWVHAEGDSCCPHLAQGWHEPSSSHPILLSLTEENRVLLEAASAAAGPGRQSRRWNPSIALPPPA